MPNIIDSLKAIAKVGGMGAAHGLCSPLILAQSGNLALQSLTGPRKDAKRAADHSARQWIQMRGLMNPSEQLRVPPGQGRYRWSPSFARAACSFLSEPVNQPEQACGHEHDAEEIQHLDNPLWSVAARRARSRSVMCARPRVRA